MPFAYALPDLGAGDWPSWFSAIGTVFAFFSAAIALILQYLTAKKAQQNVHREQASKIWAMMERTSENSSTFKLIVLNRSELPCYFTYFEVYEPDIVRWFRLGTVSSGRFEHEIELSPEYAERWPYFRISFMDATNTFWIRDSHGYLIETSGKGRKAPSARSQTFAERRAREVGVQAPQVPRGLVSRIDSIGPYVGAAPLSTIDKPQRSSAPGTR